MIAALYVESGGCYSESPNIDCWDVNRDARRYDGPYPVVAHPPCQRWGRFWHGSTRKPHQFKMGDDGGCFAAALAAVRTWGGVLEHPEHSHAWRAFGLAPPKATGWSRADDHGGWTCRVEQGFYGHFARKPTWLYACRCELPELRWGRGEQRLHPVALSRHGYAKARRIGVVAMVGGKRKTEIRNATPLEFRDVLIAMAESADRKKSATEIPMPDPYLDFIARKSVRAAPIGLQDVPPINPRLFPFQRDIVTWALRRGRAAIFAGTGLGKTGMQLEWARCVQEHTGKPVLILTPLAVAQQTVAEAEKFGLEGVAYARFNDEAEARIVVTNYDRVEKFDLSRFGAVVLDESSIIKSQESKTRALLIEMCAHIPYRLACTATPAPNDYVELGNHAEFLGVLTQKEMLATWFVHDGGIRAEGNSAEWRLKGHAQRDFWAWVASWAVMIRRPSDLGYDDAGYILPSLNVHQITVPVEYRPSVETGTLFPMEARTLQERLAARRDSIGPRVAKAAEIVNAAPDRPWLVWCNLNAESDALTKAIVDAEQIKGSDPINIKTDRLFGFTKQWPRVLVTKPTVAGFGMNWQHCADMVFVGLNDSFEQLYQAIRRCWRFGQTKPVNVYMIASETEGAVVANLKAKEAAAEAMAENLAEHMRDLCQREVRGGRVASNTQRAATQPMELPRWLLSKRAA